MRSEYNTRQKKKAMLEALRATLGIVTAAAEKTGIGRDNHYRWLREDADYATAVRDLEDVALDFAETALFRQIKDNDTAATIFFLKTKARHRGYIERKEMDVTSKGEHIAKPPIVWTDEAGADVNA